MAPSIFFIFCDVEAASNLFVWMPLKPLINCAGVLNTWVFSFLCIFSYSSYSKNSQLSSIYTERDRERGLAALV